MTKEYSEHLQLVVDETDDTVPVKPDLVENFEKIDAHAKDTDATLATVVGAPAALEAETTQRVAGDSALSQAIDAEATARDAADATNASQLTAEINARQSGDAALQTAINQTNAALSTTDAANDAALTTETQSRQSGDQALQDDVDLLTTGLTNEANTRAAGDTALSSTISGVSADLATETTARETGDEDTLAAAQAAVADEATARTAADTAINTALDSKADLIDGKMDPTQVPAIALSSITPVGSEAAMLAFTAEPGDVAKRTDLPGAPSFMLSAAPATSLANWTPLHGDFALDADLDAEISARAAGDSNAIATASADATTKANAARDAAVATAATDATTKADAAEAAAIASANAGLAQEATARADADAALTTALNTKASTAALDAEIAARVAADGDKADQSALDAEVQARQTGDTDTLAAAATDASTKASAAQSAAIAAAATDATNKTDAAQSAAISTAAIDATNKVNAEATARTTALALKADKDEQASVSAYAYGLEDGLTATATTAALQAAINAVAELGVKLVIPDRGTPWQINGPLTVSAPGADIEALGEIEQLTWGKPVFDVMPTANDSRIIFRRVFSTQPRTHIPGGGFRGDQLYLYSAGVFLCADNCTIKGRSEGFTAGIVPSGWDGTSGLNRRGKSNTIDMTVKDVDFGALVLGQDELNITMRGTYALQTNSPNPPHLIYFSDNIGFLRSRNPMVHGQAWDSPEYHAFQVKGVRGGAYYTETRNCGGILSLKDVQNAVFETTVVLEESGISDGTGSVYMQDANCKNLMFGTVRIDQAVPGRAIRTFGSDHTFGDVSINCVENSDSSLFHIVVGGNRVDVGKVRINNSGTGQRNAVQFLDGSGHILQAPEMRNVKRVIDVQPGVVDARVDIDPLKIQLAATNSGYLSDAGTNTQHGARNTERVLSGWVTVANPTLSLGTVIGPMFVRSVDIYVDQAFNSAGSDNIRVGHDNNNTQWAGLTDVSTTGDKVPTAGSAARYRFQSAAGATTVKAYYVTDGAAPTTGKALVVVRLVSVAAAP